MTMQSGNGKIIPFMAGAAKIKSLTDQIMIFTRMG